MGRIKAKYKEFERSRAERRALKEARELVRLREREEKARIKEEKLRIKLKQDEERAKIKKAKEVERLRRRRERAKRAKKVEAKARKVIKGTKTTVKVGKKAWGRIEKWAQK